MKKIAWLFLLWLLIPCTAYGADYYTAATARTQIRSLLNESTASFWTDDEIDNWVKEAVEDISARTFCIQESDTFSLVTSQYEYTDFTTAGASASTDVLKVWGCFYVNPNDEYIGLKEIHPAMVADLQFTKSGPPKYYYHFADKIGVFPLPTSSENGQLVRIYYSKQSQTIGDLPNEYQPLTFWYAASMAYKKEHRLNEADTFYKMYLEAIQALRNDLHFDPTRQKPTEQQQ